MVLPLLARIGLVPPREAKAASLRQRPAAAQRRRLDLYMAQFGNAEQVPSAE
jgi:hypothetical protein